MTTYRANRTAGLAAAAGFVATIVLARAISEFGRLKLTGLPAWWFWLLVHIYRLSGFRNRFSVLFQWAWSY